MKPISYCFDLDGTITRDEILPVIARQVGLEDEISALTLATINGHLPFDKSLKLRAMLLKECDISEIHKALAREIRVFDSIVEFIRSKGDNCFVVTGNLDIWIAPLLRSLSIEHVFSSQGELENGKLKRVSMVLNKGRVVEQLKSRYRQVVAIGDGANDVPMFEYATWRIAFGGSHDPHADLCKVSDFVCYTEESLCTLLSML
jgi:HAD superfamily phosphoserine phosphatase-like hydrolase